LSAEHTAPPEDGAPAFDYSEEPAAKGFKRANGAHHDYGAGAPGPERAIPPFAFARLDAVALAQRAAVVQNLGWDEGAVAAVVGPPNAGKTAFAVHGGLSVAGSASRWLGLKVAGGPVAYVGAEAPGSVKMRAQAAQRRLELGNQALPFYVVDAAPGLGDEIRSFAESERILATLAAIASTEGAAVKLCFIDTLASCLGDGDENGDGMIRLVAAAKHIALRASTCVVLIHHPSKGDATGLRGHGSLAAACDSILSIAIESPLTGVRTATLIKARDHATGLQLRFQLEPVALPDRDQFGDPCTTVVVVPSTAPVTVARPAGKRQEQLLTELERRHRDGEKRWDRAAVTAAAKGLGFHRNTAAAALDGLISAGYMTGPASAYTLTHPPEAL
jgi:AAA domain-containing protein